MPAGPSDRAAPAPNQTPRPGLSTPGAHTTRPGEEVSSLKRFSMWFVLAFGLSAASAFAQFAPMGQLGAPAPDRSSYIYVTYEPRYVGAEALAELLGGTSIRVHTFLYDGGNGWGGGRGWGDGSWGNGSRGDGGWDRGSRGNGSWGNQSWGNGGRGGYNGGGWDGGTRGFGR